jgi:hypothetical protein
MAGFYSRFLPEQNTHRGKTFQTDRITDEKNCGRKEEITRGSVISMHYLCYNVD